jgi:MFS family permease
MFVGMVLTIASSIPMAYLHGGTRYWIYPLAGVQGLGLAILLNTATSLISDMIGVDQENCGFVYGCYGFMEKISGGTIICYMVANFTDSK